MLNLYLIQLLTHQQLSLYLQIISKTAAKIPWNELDLPEGRTIKACQMIIDKDRRQLAVDCAFSLGDEPAKECGETGVEVAHGGEMLPDNIDARSLANRLWHLMISRYDVVRNFIRMSSLLLSTMHVNCLYQF